MLGGHRRLLDNLGKILTQAQETKDEEGPDEVDGDIVTGEVDTGRLLHPFLDIFVVKQF